MKSNPIKAGVSERILRKGTASLCRDIGSQPVLSHLTNGGQRLLFEDAVPENGTGFRDPAFTENRLSPLHRWVPWIAGFSAGFVQDVLRHFLKRAQGATVLDPFAGVGTTLVEAYQAGCDVVGFEINPYAELATRLKLAAIDMDPEEIERLIHGYEKFYYRKLDSNGSTNVSSVPPEGFKTRHPFFSKRVERKVLIGFDYLSGIRNKRYADLFRLALGSIMVKISNYSYEPSLGRRSASGKPDIEDYPVEKAVLQKLREMLDDIRFVKRRMGLLEEKPSYAVHNKSIFEALSHLSPSRVDLVITSPPYLNNYHYVRNTRPQMYWLGFVRSSGDLSAYEENSFGKFWQTVREDSAVSLTFKLTELERVLSVLRQTNEERGVYGGHGWANYAATYFNDCYRFAGVLRELLKPGSYAVVVLGNSILQGIEVKTEHFFGEISKLQGLQWVGTELLRKKRTGTSIVNSSIRATNGARTESVLSESAIIVRRA